MSFRIIPIIVFSLLLLALTAAELTEAALKPEEISVIVNTNSPDSVRIGELYIKLRKIPSDHLIKINVAAGEYISRTDYDGLIAGPVRKALNGLYDKGEKIRCLVTTYGVPLRIGAVSPLIIPEDEIKESIRLRDQIHEKWQELKKRRKADGNPDKDLNREIGRLKREKDDLNLKISNLRGYDTVAAVDSELALAFMPDYTLAGWQPNPEHIYTRERKIIYFGQVLMVSRLDAPTPELAEGLIRTAIEVEKTGLSGTLYLDARGLKGKGAYGKFDKEIIRAAEVLQKGLMTVILDNKPELFGPGDAPSAALYCGWYSIGKYVDAFEWVKGAVGYHVASSEAVSLHNPSGTYWVKSMIEKGVIATLGPVAEPYLQAFPSPPLFFQLLMSGRYSLAEVFAMTNPFLSWRMILIGDPLYNPFKVRPAYKLGNAPPPPR